MGCSLFLSISPSILLHSNSHLSIHSHNAVASVRSLPGSLDGAYGDSPVSDRVLVSAGSPGPVGGSHKHGRSIGGAAATSSAPVTPAALRKNASAGGRNRGRRGKRFGRAREGFLAAADVATGDVEGEAADGSRGQDRPRAVFDAGMAEELRFFIDQVYLLFLPIFATFALVIWFVRTTLVGDGGPASGAAPALVYTPAAGDDASTVLGGSLLNALVIVGTILVVTLLFIALYRWRCYRILYAWLGLSMLLVLGFVGGLTAAGMLAYYNVPCDWPTFALVLWNFVVVGLVAIFYRVPMFVQQAYLVLVSSLMVS